MFEYTFRGQRLLIALVTFALNMFFCLIWFKRCFDEFLTKCSQFNKISIKITFKTLPKTASLDIALLIALISQFYRRKYFVRTAEKQIVPDLESELIKFFRIYRRRKIITRFIRGTLWTGYSIKEAEWRAFRGGKGELVRFQFELLVLMGLVAKRKIKFRVPTRPRINQFQ